MSTDAVKARVLVTGANGHLGRRLIRAIGDRYHVIAVVRSERARSTLEAAVGRDRADIAVIDYQDVAGLAAVATGCRAVVHLVGILKEGRTSSYREAHEGATRALLEALGPGGAEVRFVYLSILGANPDSPNACLASKGRAESMLLEASPSALVLQVPMVLGEGDYASRALAGTARAPLGFTFRGRSREQPVYAGDVTAAIEAALERPAIAGTVVLAGPESLSRRELIERAGRVLGARPRVISLPIWLGGAVAWVLETLLPDPPLTRAMLGVLDHDDDVDSSNACRLLELELTSLDDTLAACVTG